MSEDDLDKLLALPTIESLFEPHDRTKPVDVGLDEEDNPFPSARYDLVCGDCGSSMQIVSTPAYKRPFYGCKRFPECRGTLGAHKDGRPLGVPTNREGREARQRAHHAFDQIWKDKVMSRDEAYTWLQKAMGLSREKAHIAMMTKEECERLLKIVTRSFPFTQDALSQILYLDDDDYSEDDL